MSSGRLDKQKALQTGGLLVSSGGLEPSTNGLKGHCSAIELRAHFQGGVHFITCNYLRQRNIDTQYDVYLVGGTNDRCKLCNRS